MAKQQTFGDKMKKKKDDRVVVKVIKGMRTPEGSTKFIEQFVKVDDVNQADKAVN
jgi:hypothetical protein